MKWASGRPDFAPGRYRLPMGRGKPKEHGDPADRNFLAAPTGGVVVLEDVTTTGGSLLAALDSLAETDAKVLAAVGLTSRMELRDDGRSVAAAVEEKGAGYVAMCTAEDFLPAAVERFAPGESIVRSIQEEFERYGERPIKLI